ncbi:MAG: amidophosphoribosyltransferase [Candidatus Marinimicrobia bacterium]|nr:amidophosphoribosyltransferase [Candidatus Neomarinimicrobiota bacterium]|tara:strand:- start:5167 stop:6621 length:1455 start_codon:yes stop_codon:yes gene_type:complete
MCGVIGLYNTNSNVANDIYDGLIQLQHRGQDAAGIATIDESKMHLYKNTGLVTEVFKSKKSKINLTGKLGIGHVRYPTAGSNDVNDSQPFYTANPVNITLAHNGTLTNADAIREKLLKTHFCQFNTSSDSEVLMNFFAYELSKTNFRKLTKSHIFKAVKAVYEECSGGFSIVSLVSGIGLVAFRDPNGIRPLSIGQKGKSFMVASESSALAALDFDSLDDIKPGEIIIIEENGDLTKRKIQKKNAHTPCLFEFVYFSRPDSSIDNISVHKSRLRMGDFLGEKIIKEYPKLNVDVVIPIPDTSRTSAMQVAYKLGVKYREGFMKNRYIGRTFIMPGQNMRQRSVKQKLNPIDIEFKGKRVLLIDDSIVRGNTSKNIIKMVKKCGAKKVFLASASPPIRYQNIYGIDMPATTELIGYKRSIKDIKKYIKADELIYQNLEDLKRAATIGNPKITEFEDSVFTGNYRVGKITKDFLKNLEKTRSSLSK